MNELLMKQKQYIEQKGKITYNERIDALKQLKKAIKSHEEEILTALNQDLGKSEFEAYSQEVGYVYHSIDYTIKHLKKWMKRIRVKNEIAQMGGKSYIYKAHYGNVLIIGPYNYPFQLVIEPLIGAIAGGNTIIVKPSEYTPNVERIINEILSSSYDEEYIKVVVGDASVSSTLLDLNFDYVFFTGSVRVGQIVMEKCAKHLTPHTLELGGKSPAIVDQTANLELAAKKIVWGKFNNVGQTCVAPDYCIVHESIYDEFLDTIVKTIQQFYGNDVLNNKDYGRVVNERHMRRLVELLYKDSNKLHYGGTFDLEERFIEPTVLKDITLEDAIMQDEIFGPILPILKYSNDKEIKTIISNHPNPLALYVFSSRNDFVENLFTTISFGGGCLNDTITHVASNHLPFGGVKTSGVGQYHGKYSFETFTYKKGIVKKGTKFDFDLIYPPFNNKIKLVKKIMK